MFQNFFTGVILLAAFLVGIGMYPAIETSYRETLRFLDLAVIGLFTVEVVVRMGAYGSKPWKYFEDGWNIFDFVIVFFSLLFLLPVLSGGSFIPALRLVRILRVLRVLRAFPELQFLVDILIRSVRYIGWVGVLLFILLYLYAVLGVTFFREYAPDQFGTLHDALLTLVGVITLDGWTTTFTDLRAKTPLLAVPYFLSFIAIGALLMINLVLGVIMKAMEDAKEKR